MDPPRMAHSVRAEIVFVENNARAFFLNACININSYFLEVTTLSGLLCDQQRRRELFQRPRGCGV